MSDDILRDGIPSIIEAARTGKGEAKVIDLAAGLDIDGLDSIPMLAISGEDGSANTESVFDEVQKWRREYATRPRFREGTILTHDLSSFIEATNRDSNPGSSVIFANVGARSLTAILDFHNEGGDAGKGPRFGRNRVEYKFNLSPQLQAWQVAAASPMDQRTFAALIDNRLGDIADIESDPPDPKSIAAQFASRRGIALASIKDLLVFTRTIAAKASTVSEEIHDDATGDVSIQYTKKSDLKTPDGAAVLVPQAFALKIPILCGLGATEFTIAVRLRYDIGERGIAWRIEINALDQYVLAAVDECLTIVRGAKDATVVVKGKDDKPETIPMPGCGLPVFMGVAPPTG